MKFQVHWNANKTLHKAMKVYNSSAKVLEATWSIQAKSWLSIYTPTFVKKNPKTQLKGISRKESMVIKQQQLMIL